MGAPASAPYLPAPPSFCLPAARPSQLPCPPCSAQWWLPSPERRANSNEFLGGYWLTHMEQISVAQAAPPSRCTEKRRFFGGLGERPRASCLGRRRSTSTAQGAGNHSGLWEKRQIRRAGQKICELPLCISLQTPEAESYFICVIFAANFKRFPQGEFLSFFNFVFSMWKFSRSTLCLYVHDK